MLLAKSDNRKVLLLVIIMLLGVYSSNAQIREKIKERVLVHKNKADNFISQHQHVSTDTLYVDRPKQAWTFRIKTDIHRKKFSIKGFSDTQENMIASLRSKLEEVIGFHANYRGLSIAASMNPKRLFGKSSNTGINFNYYNNAFGIDLSYNTTNEFDGKIRIGNSNKSTSIEDTQLKNVSANLYYVFNRKKFSYPAAFNHSWIQKRSAGSFLIAASFYTGKFTSDYDDGSSFLAHKKSINMNHISLGGGYGYNFVANKHWFFHISGQTTLMIWKNYKLSLVADKNTGEAIVEKIHNSKPEFSLLGRAGLSYSWNNYFVGLSGVLQSYKVGKNNGFSLTNKEEKIRLYFGMRLENLF